MTFIKLIQEDEFTEDDEIIHSKLDFVSVINDPATLEFLKNIKDQNFVNPKDFLTESKNKQELKRIAICFLQSFVSSNWFGVETITDQQLEDVLKKMFPKENEYLGFTDETFKGVKNKSHLCLSKSVLGKSEAASIWKLRYLLVHQMILETPATDLYLDMKRTLLTFESFMKDEVKTMKGHLLKLQVAIELAQAFLWYTDVSTSSSIIENVKDFSGIKVTFDGALGRKTRYQVDAKSQLIVKISRSGSCSSFADFNPPAKKQVEEPKNISNSDDTLLNQIKFVDEKLNCSQNELFYPAEECWLLLLALHSKRSVSSSDELANEELSAFINYIINKSSLWSVRFKALFVRSLIERNSSRRIERSMMQLDHLVNCFSNSKKEQTINQSNIVSHLEFFYSSMFEPSWVCEKNLADTLCGMGCTKAALEIYERLNYWEEVIKCYHRLDRKDKAEAVVLEQLKTNENSPYLWCLLGEAKDDLSCFEKSWKLSNEKYFKAQKLIGDYFFKRKEYEKCLEPFKLSLKINSLQIDTWSRLGYCCLVTDDFETCVRAYRRYVEFEPDVFEAWNNMSKAYIKLGHKEKAFMTLQEAIKCNYEEWKLWDNYMVVSMDVGAFEEVIRSYHRLIDLKNSHEDDQVIELLTNAIVGDVKDMNGIPSSRLVPKLSKLFARINSTSFATFQLGMSQFKLANHLYTTGKDLDTTKILEALRRTNRGIVRDLNWNNNVETSQVVLRQSLVTLRLLKDVLSKIEDENEKKKAKDSFRLSFQSVLRTAELTLCKWDPTRKEVEQAETLKTQLESDIKDIL